MSFRQNASYRMMRLALVGSATMVFMLVTSPLTLPALLLVTPFFGMFIFLYLLLLEVLRFLGPSGNETSMTNQPNSGEQAGRVSQSASIDQSDRGAIIRVRRPRLLAAVIAAFPVLLLVLQSIVLTKWDVLIALAIVLLAYVYISRSSVSFRRR